MNKEYLKGQLMEARVGGYWLVVRAFQRKRIVTAQGCFRYSEIEGWRLPWGATFQPNLHMILPLCNRGSQKIW